MAKKEDFLLPEINGAKYIPYRRKNLFLQRFLNVESSAQWLQGPDHDRAHGILVKWADLAKTGELVKRKETNLRSEFLVEVFGEALGYTLYSENLDRWNLEYEFSVNGGTADAAIGTFRPGEKKATPRAVIEMKGPTVNLDRDRFNGRTAVQQCWDYLNALPDCPWGIVSNFVSFRLYHRDCTPRAYQGFTLEDLRLPEVFRQFYYLLEKGGLLGQTIAQKPRADRLLEMTARRQKEVGDELYQSYHGHRVALIRHLRGPGHRKTLSQAIYIAQKLLDRIIFVAFCEDRGLLPERAIWKASTKVPPFSRVTNPRWQNFMDLFRSIDEGNDVSGVTSYNGGLFRKDPEVDNLQLPDEWTHFFKEVGDYDFRDEVNVDVLGHLFERSVHDIERIQRVGLYKPVDETEKKPKMVKSALRKRSGIYYTPPEFTGFIVEKTIGAVIEERLAEVAKRHKLAHDDFGMVEPSAPHVALWRDTLAALRDIKVVDPACGSGAFLIRAFDLLEAAYQNVVDHLIYHEDVPAGSLYNEIADFILQDNLFGVDLSFEAVEITQLALWIRSARVNRTLADLSKNIVCGNSLVAEKESHPHALSWEQTFSAVFDRPNRGFDCVIGNPPWERIKLQEREFFDAARPDIAAAVNAATRRKLIAQLKKTDPKLHQRYTDARTRAEQMLNYVHRSERFPLAGKGDVNTYAVFAELARSLVASGGRVGLLVPSGIATDHTTREFFAELTDSESLYGLYDFENKAPMFPDVHRSYKFCVLLFGGSLLRFKSADFFFFARTMDDLEDKKRHIPLSDADFKLLNPNTRTCPIFRTCRDAELTRAIYRRIPILIDRNRKKGGNPWGIRFVRMFDQTNDAELFRTADELKAGGFKRDGIRWKKRKQVFLPLYEAKMIQAYDHRAAGVVVKDANWMRQGQTVPTLPVQHQNPEFFVEPRWWVEECKVVETLRGSRFPAFFGFKDITSPTNQRTMIAASIPWSAVTNHFPLLLTDRSSERSACLIANLNCFALDYVARQKIGGVTLNFFIVEQLPIFPPDFYEQRCVWDRRQSLERWISDRVLKLTCVSEDMRPLAEAAGLESPITRWDPAERAELMAELDAAYFLLYGLKRKDVAYVLSTFSGIDQAEEGLLGSIPPARMILRHYDRLCRVK